MKSLITCSLHNSLTSDLTDHQCLSLTILKCKLTLESMSLWKKILRLLFQIKKKERKKYFTVMHFGYINVTLNVLIQEPTGLSDYLLMVLL